MSDSRHGAEEYETKYEAYELSEEVVARRRFISYIAGLLTGVIGLLLAIPLVGFVIGPLLTKKASPWVRLGGLSDIKPNEPTKFTYSFQRLDGWQQKTVRGTAYIVAQDTATLTVFSNVCTHLGCGVRWDPTSQTFLCPCHGGVFNLNGKVIAGPPPRPLDQFEYKVEGGVVFIKMREG